MENIQVNKEGLKDGLTPAQVVEKLDAYIIGQNKAKRFVSVALRNRQRRIKLPPEIRDEVAPKNILMIGPTGVGKTEIARRLAKLCAAPFLKVEATKYTEVGYVGRDVESMVRDLMAVGFNMVKAEMQEQLKEKCIPLVEEDLLDLLLPGSSGKKKEKTNNSLKPNFSVLGNIFGENSPVQGSLIKVDIPKNIMDEQKLLETSEDNSAEKNNSENVNEMSATREKFRQYLREGKLEDRTVQITVTSTPKIGGIGFGAGNIEDLEQSLNGIQEMLGGGKSKTKTVTVKEAREILMAQNLERITDTDKVAEEAKNRVEQSGIIFIDEIDKIATKGGASGGRAEVSREGVQRDILPIVEGCDVNTKWGVINTTHILFIGAGAFSVSTPNDLIPELQGRFPLRVELEALKKEEFKRILTEPKNALVKQYAALLGTEGVELKFSEDAIDTMSFIAEDVNSRAENIGARRLHTIMETVLEDLSFNADLHCGETIEITSDYVNERLGNIVQDQNLERYIL